jgi:hypothetical protein
LGYRNDSNLDWLPALAGAGVTARAAARLIRTARLAVPHRLAFGVIFDLLG